MATELIPAEEIEAHLISLGIVQAEAAPPSLEIPRCVKNPRDRVPEPKDGENAMVGIYTGPEIPGEWLEGFLQERLFEFVVRSRKEPQGELIQRQIRAALEEQKGVMFGQLRIEWSKLANGEQPVAADKTSYSSIQGFRIAYRIASLTV